MKASLPCLLVFVGLSVAACPHDPVEALASKGPTAYTVYEGYSFSGRYQAADTTMFFHTTTRAAFDSLFFFIYDHNEHTPVPAADFATKKVVSIVKYGNNYYDLRATGVTVANGILEVAYDTTMLHEGMSWTATVPLIITLSADYRKIRFTENGRLVREVTP